MTIFGNRTQAGGRLSIYDLVADFESQSPGSLASLFGITCARSSANGTVLTSVATVSTALAANTIRIENDGVHHYARAEEARTNLIGSPRAPQTVGPWAIAGATPGTGNYAVGPDGTNVAFRAACASGAVSNYQTIATPPGTYVGSVWQRATTTGDLQYVLNAGAVTTPLVAAAAGTSWIRYTGSLTSVVGSFTIITQDGRDQSGVGGQAARAHDAVMDMFQLSLGEHDVSFRDGAGAADLLSIDSTPYVGGGNARIELQTKAMHASSAFAADQYLARWDANNHIRVQQSNRRMMVTLNGVAFELPVAIPAFSANDLVDYFVECGPSQVTHGWIDINGSLTDLGYSPTPQSSVPTGTMSILNNGTAASGAIGLRKVVMYR